MRPFDRSHDFPGALAGISFLARSSSVTNLQEFRPVGNAESPFYTLPETPESIEDRDHNRGFDIDHDLHPVQKKRRLTDEQVKSLEVSFEVESKLEPVRKNYLARELGLQPRQVAIWFQNRRARCKAKNLEKEYEILKQQYDAALSETGRLLAEVARLRKLVVIQEARGSGFRCADQELENSRGVPQKPSGRHIQQGDTTQHAESPTHSSSLFERCLDTSLSDCFVYKHMNLHRDADDSTESDWKDGVDSRIWTPKERNVPEQYHQHTEAKFSLADQRCSSHLLQRGGALKVEENFDLYDEILASPTQHHASGCAALYVNWQQDA